MSHPLRRAVIGTGAKGPPRNDDTAVRNPMAGRDSGVPARSQEPRRAARARNENTFFFDAEGRLIERESEHQDSISGAAWDSAQPVLFSAFNVPHAAKLEFDSSREHVLIAYVSTPDDDPGQNEVTGGGVNIGASPFLVDPSIVGTTVVGGCVALGKLTYGHQGVSRHQLINLPNGQSTKIAVAGSSTLFGPLLTIKYFTPDDTDPAVRVYTVGATGPLTSERFSNPDQRDITAVIGADPTQANILTNSATCLSYLARAEAASSGGTTPKAARRFFGMLRIGGPNAHKTICPVQWGASHVQLSAPEFMQFFQVNNSIPGNPILTSGPYPSNLPIPLDDNVGAIAVESNLAVAGHELAFSVYYYPGF